MPLYASGLLYEHTDSDYLLRPSETSLGTACFAALWNARPVLARDLGRQVAMASAAALSGLRDAYLRVADPSIGVEAGRLGPRKPNPESDEWRRNEILAWQRLTGRVLGPLLAARQSVVFGAGEQWGMFTSEELSRLTDYVYSCDTLANTVAHAAVGPDVALFSMPRSLLGVQHGPYMAPPESMRSIEYSYGVAAPVGRWEMVLGNTGEFAAVSSRGEAT